MCKFLAIFWFSCLSVLAASFQPNNGPLLIGRVSANQTTIAFAAAGKIWLVDKNGGAARRLTDTPNEESDPVFSPDGSRIAFSRLNGGDWDVYVIPATGPGEARRVTMMPENDYVVSWTPDGKNVVFMTSRDEENVYRLYKMAVDGRTLAEPLPLPQAFDGSFSSDGRQFAYNPRVFIFGEWRYYRGGATSPIWIADLQTGALEKLPNRNFNDKNPLWIGDKIYFNSDRGGTYNLFVYDRKTKQTKQLTGFTGRGVQSVSATSDSIYFVQDGRIHSFDPATGQDRVISVSISPETSERSPRTVPAMRSLEQILPSSNGEKIVFGARGEVLLLDTATGQSKNLTETSGIAERYPTISPDNKTVAYFSDESGEYQLHLKSLETGAVKKIPIEPKPSFYMNLSWSPDSRKLVFSDRRLNLWLIESATGTAVRIDSSTYSAQNNWLAAFSPDSRFLTYAKRLKNRVGTVFIYDLAQKKSFRITDGITHTESPVFDANGKYLYFLSSRNALTSEFGWGVLNGVFARPLVTRNVHAFILSKDLPAPFLPTRQPNPEAKNAESVAQIRIDFDDPERRLIDLPLPPRDYGQLLTGKPGKLFLSVAEWSSTPGDFSSQTQKTSIYLFDPAKPGEMQKIVEDVNGYDLTRDGAKLLYGKGRDWFVVNAEAPPKTEEGKLDLSKLEIRVDPAAEWRQMFHESMRIMRDWFYDPNHHGQNLRELENYYAAYLPGITRRRDLNRLMEKMLGSVSVSHLGVGGGDLPPPVGALPRVGLLGADYSIENGKYRFRKIFRGTTYASANGLGIAPLDQPGVDVRDGDYLLDVNGQKVETSKNILAYFENTVGRPTRITVSSKADGTDPRTFTIYPTAGENRLRRAVWAENNRRSVDKLSGGKLGYIFIENFDGEGIMNAIRGLTGLADKQGVIIDQRYNGGGITPDYLIEWLRRKPLYYYMFRDGDDIPTPVNPAPPVKVLLVNEFNGSAAETNAFMFKLGKVGPVVGKRTGGGGIGPYFFTPRLIDGGRVQLPNRAAYHPDGTSWGIENIGVEPDVDVEMTPQDLMAGRDPQLEKAVEAAMKQIAQNPPLKPKRPPFPVHPK